MLIYLDANIVQYCADYEDFILGDSSICPVKKIGFQKELAALKELVELEQLGNWCFAAPYHLLAELHRGKPTINQLEVYKILRESWVDCGWSDEFPTDENIVNNIEKALMQLNLKDPPDRRHLAEAVALNASWFLTLDKDILKKTIKKTGGKIQHTRVSRPSECLNEISVGLFLK